jgi:hypothetical protein
LAFACTPKVVCQSAAGRGLPARAPEALADEGGRRRDAGITTQSFAAGFVSYIIGIRSPPAGAPAALALLRAWLPYAERDEVMAEFAAEFAARQVREGSRAARSRLWRQVLGSVPSRAADVLRGWTGFKPASSHLRPGGPRMESFIMDLRYAARRLRSQPT